MTTLTAISWLLLVVSCALWLLSGFEGQWWTVGPFHPAANVVTSYGVAWGDGSVGFARDRLSFSGPDPAAVAQSSAMFNVPAGLSRSRPASPATLARVGVPGRRSVYGFVDARLPQNGWFPGHVRMSGEMRFTGVPFWLVTLAFALLPAASVPRLRREWRRRQRARARLCEACGYDLRGSPERCPECGAASSDRVRNAAQSSTDHLVSNADRTP